MLGRTTKQGEGQVQVVFSSGQSPLAPRYPGFPSACPVQPQTCLWSPGFLSNQSPWDPDDALHGSAPGFQAPLCGRSPMPLPHKAGSTVPFTFGVLKFRGSMSLVSEVAHCRCSSGTFSAKTRAVLCKPRWLVMLWQEAEPHLKLIWV